MQTKPTTMPLITLDIPAHKIPLIKEFIEEIGLAEKNRKSLSGTYYTSNTQNTRHYLPTSYTQSSKGWEFFRNELEYE